MRRNNIVKLFCMTVVNTLAIEQNPPSTGYHQGVFDYEGHTQFRVLTSKIKSNHFDTLTRNNNTLTLNVNMIELAFRNLTTEELELFLPAEN